MSQNRKLQKAYETKDDEFYTQLTDIEEELMHYRNHFRGATIFCNCDDPYESNFFKFFALNFNYFGLKKLITTCYAGSPVVGKELPLLSIAGLETPPADGEELLRPADQRLPHKIEITEVLDHNQDGATDLADVEYLLRNEKNTLSLLEGNGDFRSEECIELLKEADIVVTNPPFSLFREYVAQLMEYDKKFLIIGNKNAITYVEIFSWITSNAMWTGMRNFSGGMWFEVPEDNDNFDKIKNGVKLKNVPSIWFTNLDHSKRHEVFIFGQEYSPERYPKYVNYDAIDVKNVPDIPDNYYEDMGVPISFLDKHNPDQFEIIGSSRELGRPMRDIAPKGSYVQGGMRFYLDNGDGTYKRQYERIVIRRKKQ